MNISLKRCCRLIFLCLTLLSKNSTAETLANSYIFKLQVPSHITNTSGLKAYYKGYQIDLSELWALLPECENILTFSLLITENVDVKAKGNTIRYLKRIEDLDFKWYDLTLTFDVTETANTYQWTVEERDADSTPARLPENTIVLLADPNFIDSLAPEPALPISSNISMPAVMFKKDIDKDEFKEALVRSVMATLNLDAIHEKANRSVCQKRHEAAIISLAAQ